VVGAGEGAGEEGDRGDEGCGLAVLGGRDAHQEDHHDGDRADHGETGLQSDAELWQEQQRAVERKQRPVGKQHRQRPGEGPKKKLEEGRQPKPNAGSKWHARRP